SALVREQVSQTRKARLHWVAATWFRLTGELDSAMAQIEEAILILERVDDPVLAAQIVDCRGIVRALTGDLAGAETDFSASVRMLTLLPPGHAVVRSLNNLAQLHTLTGH